ncbi:hypothetical protein ACLOJK_025927 [Asimina triloba]
MSVATDQKWVSRCCLISYLKEADLLLSPVEPRWVSIVDAKRQRRLCLWCQQVELLLPFDLGSMKVLLIGSVLPLLRFILDAETMLLLPEEVIANAANAAGFADQQVVQSDDIPTLRQRSVSDPKMGYRN